ncbi:hypothetical protein HanXRQr2_Chr05g0225881 [Helianthus annuus]|uniref:Uncharacterized protein n=1 Tax=Helianthus annuus TaxID=4232 RepID=A0A251UT09_HELAN|nr:hypothetical protein HanXRQr2_Chr05g0225881 [Helianthus annuus]KAJ0923606.1 hypothetical protein HanPSC8_Chr05g0217941 [Helianthus annuus]
MHPLTEVQSDESCCKHYSARTHHGGRLGCAVSRIHLLYSALEDKFHPTLSSHHCTFEPKPLTSNFARLYYLRHVLQIVQDY